MSSNNSKYSEEYREQTSLDCGAKLIHVYYSSYVYKTCNVLMKA